MKMNLESSNLPMLLNYQRYFKSFHEVLVINQKWFITHSQGHRAVGCSFFQQTHNKDQRAIDRKLCWLTTHNQLTLSLERNWFWALSILHNNKVILLGLQPPELLLDDSIFELVCNSWKINPGLTFPAGRIHRRGKKCRLWN